MKNKIICLCMMAIMIASFTGCMDPDLPVYKTEKSDTDGFCVIMNGVKYKELPPLNWGISYGKRVLGYAGSGRMEILEASGDPEHNFIYLNDLDHAGWDRGLKLLYRTDKALPQPSADSVTALHYSEDYIYENKVIQNTVTDRSVIRELFKALNDGEKRQMPDLKGFDRVGIGIGCTSDAVPGASYVLGILRYGEKIMCGNALTDYTEISKQLLEKIAGHKIDIKAWMGN